MKISVKLISPGVIRKNVIDQVNVSVKCLIYTNVEKFMNQMVPFLYSFAQQEEVSSTLIVIRYSIFNRIWKTLDKLKRKYFFINYVNVFLKMLTITSVVKDIFYFN